MEKNNLSEQRDYLSLDNTNSLKGIFAVFVLLCHLRGRMPFLNGSLIGSSLTALGYTSVAMFFFFSGYGLMTSYKKKGHKYVEAFPKKRLLSFYITYLAFVCIYLIYDLITGEFLHWGWKTIIKTLTFGGTIIHNGWYLQAILLFYIIFWLVFYFIKNDCVKVVVMTISIAFYSLACAFLFDLGELWYEASFALILGMIWALNKQKIDEALQKRWLYWGGLVLLIIVTLIAMFLGWNQTLKGFVRIPIKMLSALSFVVCVLLLVQKVRVDFFITQFLGKISFEIYILHGLFIDLFVVICKIGNPCIFVPLVFVTTILSAFVLSILRKFIKINKRVKNGNEN